MITADIDRCPRCGWTTADHYYTAAASDNRLSFSGWNTDDTYGYSPWVNESAAPQEIKVINRMQIHEMRYPSYLSLDRFLQERHANEVKTLFRRYRR